MRLNLESPIERANIRHSKRTGSAAVRRRSRVTPRLFGVSVAPVPTRVVKPDGNPRCRTFAEVIDERLRTARSNPDDGNHFFSLSRDGDGPRAPPDVTRPPIRGTPRGPGTHRPRRKKPRHRPTRSAGLRSPEPCPEKRCPSADPLPHAQRSQTWRGTGVVARVGDALAPPAEPSPGNWPDKETRPATETRHRPPFYIGHCNNETRDESGRKPPYTLSANNADSDAKVLAKPTTF
jgi:hypothetical protein